MATYYVTRNDHLTNRVRYSTISLADAIANGVAAATVQTVVTLAGANGVVLLDGGAWAAADIDTDGALTMAANGAVLGNVAGFSPVIDLDGVTGNGIYAYGAGWLVYGLEVRNCDGNALYPAGSGVVRDCKLRDNLRHVNANAFIGSMYRNTFYGNSNNGSNQGLVFKGATSNVKFYFNKLLPSQLNLSPRILFQDALTAYVCHNVSVGGDSSFLDYLSGNPNVYAENNIAVGFAGNSGKVINLLGTGTRQARNNIVYTGVTTPSAPIAASTSSGNITTTAPLLKKCGRPGYICFSVDDYNDSTYDSWAYISALIPELQSRGLKMTWYINADAARNCTDYAARILAAKNSGVVEIGLHTWSHSRMQATQSITVTCTGTNATIRINRETGKVDLFSDEAGAVSVPSGDFRTTRLLDIRTAINAVSGFTAILSGTDCNDYALGEVMLDDGVKAIGAGYIVPIDRTIASEPAKGFFKAELLDPLDFLENIVGVGTITSFAYPGGSYDATAKEAIRTIRGGQLSSARRTDIDANSSQLISSLDRYVLAAYNHPDFKVATSGGTASDDIIAGTHAICAYAAEAGAIISTYAHAVSELSVEQWCLIFDAAVQWRSCGLNVGVAMGDAVSQIIALSTDAGNGTSTYVWPEDQGDYRISDLSLAAHGGVAVADVTDTEALDPWGHEFPADPNIGMDQGAAPGFGPWTAFATMPTLELAPTAPGSLLEVQEWSKSNITKKQIDKASR